MLLANSNIGFDIERLIYRIPTTTINAPISIAAAISNLTFR